MRRAVVVGRSAAALDEYAAARELCDFDDLIVVGKMGTVFPDRVDHWVSFHHDLFGRWARERARAGLSPAACYWGSASGPRRRARPSADAPAPLRLVENVGGSSGFMAMRQVALRALGCARVVLAGIPMRAEDGHYSPPARAGGGEWEEADVYWPTWQEHMAELRGRVRSMSGRTRDALGEPTREWLRG